MKSKVLGPFGAANYMEEKLNDFLKTIDESAFVDLKFSSNWRPDSRPPILDFSVIITYRE